jgi:hypothetical protein
VPTAFEKKAQKLGLSEHQWSSSLELLAWARKNKEKVYIPERFLIQANLTTIYHTNELAEYSLASGTVIPEQSPLQEDHTEATL